MTADLFLFASMLVCAPLVAFLSLGLDGDAFDEAVSELDAEAEDEILARAVLIGPML